MNNNQHREFRTFCNKEKKKSIHLASWPTNKDSKLLNEVEQHGVDLMLAAITEVRKYKTSQN